MHRITRYLLGSAALTIVLLGTQPAWAADIEVTSPRRGTYRPGQNITVQWKSGKKQGPVTVRISSVKGKHRVVLVRMAQWRKAGLRVQIPRDLGKGSYVIEVIRGRDRGKSGIFQVRPRLAPATPGTARFVPTISVQRPRAGTYYPGQQIEALWEARGVGHFELVLYSVERNSRQSRGSTRAHRAMVSLPASLERGTYEIWVRSTANHAIQGKSARFFVEPLGPVPRGKNEHALESVSFAANGQRLRAIDAARNVYELPYNGGTNVRFTMLVSMRQLTPVQRNAPCSPGVVLDFAYDHYPGRRYDMAGRVFSPTVFHPSSMGARLMTTKIPLRVPDGTPTNVTMSGEATLGNIAPAACDHDRTNNTGSFELRLVPYRPRADLQLRLKNLSLKTLTRIGVQHAQFEVGVVAADAREEIRNVKVRWRCRYYVDGAWRSLEGDPSPSEVVINTVYADRITWHRGQVGAPIAEGNFPEKVRVHLAVWIDRDVEVDDPVRGNNDLSRTWEWVRWE